MRFEATIDYPAPLVRVHRLLSDEDFVRDKIAAAGASPCQVDIDDSEAGLTIVARVKMPTDEVPPALRSIVGPTLDIRLVEAWQVPTSPSELLGSISVDIAGAPVQVAGRMRLGDTGTQSRQEVRGDITASVPLLGGPIERAAHEAVMATIDGQRRVARTYLAGT